MMRAEKLPREELLEVARAGYRERYSVDRPNGKPPANVGPALHLIGAESIRVPYRGRVYELGYTSFEDGLRLVRARAAIVGIDEADTSPESLAAYLQAVRLIVSMAPRYLLPVTRVRRLFWRLRLRRNPFRSATEAEVGHLLGFFLASRTRSRVQSVTPANPELVPTS